MRRRPPPVQWRDELLGGLRAGARVGTLMGVVVWGGWAAVGWLLDRRRNV